MLIRWVPFTACWQPWAVRKAPLGAQLAARRALGGDRRGAGAGEEPLSPCQARAAGALPSNRRVCVPSYLAARTTAASTRR